MDGLFCSKQRIVICICPSHKLKWTIPIPTDPTLHKNGTKLSQIPIRYEVLPSCVRGMIWSESEQAVVLRHQVPSHASRAGLNLLALVNQNSIFFSLFSCGKFSSCRQWVAFLLCIYNVLHILHSVVESLHRDMMPYGIGHVWNVCSNDWWHLYKRKC